MLSSRRILTPGASGTFVDSADKSHRTLCRPAGVLHSSSDIQVTGLLPRILIQAGVESNFSELELLMDMIGLQSIRDQAK